MVLYAPVDTPSIFDFTLVLVKTCFITIKWSGTSLPTKLKTSLPVTSTSVIGGDCDNTEMATAPCQPGRLMHFRELGDENYLFYKYDALLYR